MEFFAARHEFSLRMLLRPEQSFSLRMLYRDRAQVKEMRVDGITCVIKTNALTSPREEAGQQVFIICGAGQSVVGPSQGLGHCGQTFAPVLSIFA